MEESKSAAPAPQSKKKLIAVVVLSYLLAGGACFLAGYSQRKVQIKEVTTVETKIDVQYKDKIVKKEKIVVKWRQAKNVVITKHVEKRPDGTVTTDTTVTDKTVTSDNSTKDNTKAEIKQEVAHEEQTVTKTKETKPLILPDWFVQVGAGIAIRKPDLATFPRSGIYSVSVSRRILWTCYAGLQGQSDPLFNSPAAFALVGCGF